MTIRPAYIKTSSGWVQIGDGNQTDLNGLFDVIISSPLDNEALVYNSSASIWNNANIVNSLYGTGSQIDVSSNNGDITLSIPNSLITPGDLEVTGNLTVSGSTTYINTQTLNVEDNIVTLNSNVTGAPTGTAGIEVERGTELNKSILWSEYDQSWNFDGDIRTYQIRSTDVFDIDISSSGSANGIVNISTDNASIVIDDIKRVVLNADGDSYKFAKDFIEFPDLSHQSTAFLGMSSYDTDDLDEGSTNLYFTNERAVDALNSTLSNYLTNSSASTIYLTQSDAGTTYLTQSSASSTYQPIGSYLTSETDPVFTASDAYGIISSDISNWNESYSWGNHASAGYSLDSHNHTLDSLENVEIYDLTDGDSIVWNSASSKWVNEVITGVSGNIVTVSSTAPTSPNIGDGWYDNTDGTYHVYDGTYWVEVTSVITMSDEEAQDKVAPLFDHANHVNITASYDDINNEIILTSNSTPDLSAYLTASVASSTYLSQDSASSTYLSQDSASSTYLSQDSASSTYLSQDSASSIYQPIGSYLISESDTLQTVIDRGATSSSAISITNTTPATSITTGALIISGGVGIGEDLYVNNDVHIGGDIHITGSISGSLTYINVTDLVVADPLIYLAENNQNDMVDIGTFGAYNHSASIKYHTGLIRDASDSGKWKLASNLLDPASNVINFTGAIFDTLKIGALEVTDASTTRTNLGLAIGTDVQAYNSTLAAVAGGTYTGDDSITTVGTISSGTWSGTTIGYTKGGTGLTTLGTAGQVLKVNSGTTGLEWGTVDALPSQSGNTGKYLTTNGSIASWATLDLSLYLTLSSASSTYLTQSGASSTYLTQSGASSTYLTQSGASSTYLTQSGASSTYLTQSGASSTYLTQSGASSTYLTQSSASTTYAPKASPTFTGTATIPTLSINGQAIMEGSTGTSSATSSFNTTTHSSAEFIIYGSTASGNYVSKVLMLARGTATPVITEYAILTQGTAPTVTITPSYSAPNAVLTVAVTSGTNIEIIATEVSI
jgi:hypothetical protein